MRERPDNQNDLAKDDELDQLVLDRLVDNDLSDVEYRKVLRLVEEKPDGWRKLAIAFLESQALEKELSALHLNSDPMAAEPASPWNAHQPTPPQTSPSPAEPLSQQTERAAKETQATRPSGEAAGNRPSRKSASGFEKSAAPGQSVEPVSDSWWTRRLRAALPAIAACIAIVFVAGLYLRELQNDKQRLSIGGDNLGRSSGDNSVVDPEYIELVSNNQADRVRAPVYKHEVFDPATFADSLDHLTPRIQQAVNRPGWKANERTHMMPIRDGTGNQIILPLKEIKLTPSSFEDYQ